MSRVSFRIFDFYVQILLVFILVLVSSKLSRLEFFVFLFVVFSYYIYRFSFSRAGSACLALPLFPNFLTRIRLGGETLEEFGGIGPLGGKCSPIPSLLGHWAFASEIEGPMGGPTYP